MVCALCKPSYLKVGARSKGVSHGPLHKAFPYHHRKRQRDSGKIAEFLKQEFGEPRGVDRLDVNGTRVEFSPSGYPTGDDSCGIEYFSEVEKLLSKIEKIAPGYTCFGSWLVDNTVAADAAASHWWFNWEDAKVCNVVDKTQEALNEAEAEWDKVFEQSELLTPGMFDYYMSEDPMTPEDALFEIEGEDPDEPFDDDETITYGEVAEELSRILNKD